MPTCAATVVPATIRGSEHQQTSHLAAGGSCWHAQAPDSNSLRPASLVGKHMSCGMQSRRQLRLQGLSCMCCQPS